MTGPRDEAEGETAASSRPVGDSHVTRSAQVVVLVGLAVVLLSVIASTASDSPDWFTAGVLALVYLAFAVIATVRTVIESRDWQVAGVQALAIVVLFLVIQRQRAGGIPESNRAFHVSLLLVLFVAFPFVRRVDASRLKRLAPFVLAGAVVIGVHFYHVVGLYRGTGLASFPVFVALILSANLYFVPQHVSRAGFFRVVSVVAGATVLVGLVAYVTGPYELFGLDVRFWQRSVTLPVGGMKVNVMRSVFPNPNGLGLLAFAGTFTALVESVEAFRATDEGSLAIGDGGTSEARTQQDVGLTESGGVSTRKLLAIFWTTAVPVVLVLLNGLGLLLSYSRGSMLALAVAVGIYLGYARFGRRAVVPGAVAVASLVVVFLTAVYTSVIPISDGKRFALWTAAMQSFLADPTLFGQGIVATSDLLEPYVAPVNAGLSPHNSYLVILLRAGLLGFAGYLVLTVGSVVAGLARVRSIDVAALAFAIGWVVHQLFESYSLFHFTTGAVLSSLAIGYLLVSLAAPPETTEAPSPESLGDAFR